MVELIKFNDGLAAVPSDNEIVVGDGMADHVGIVPFDVIICEALPIDNLLKTFGALAYKISRVDYEFKPVPPYIVPTVPSDILLPDKLVMYESEIWPTLNKSLLSSTIVTLSIVLLSIVELLNTD